MDSSTPRARVRVSRCGPSSSSTTSKPASQSTRAAVAPPAPVPTMTKSAESSNVCRVLTRPLGARPARVLSRCYVRRRVAVVRRSHTEPWSRLLGRRSRSAREPTPSRAVRALPRTSRATGARARRTCGDATPVDQARAFRARQSDDRAGSPPVHSGASAMRQTAKRKPERRERRSTARTSREYAAR